LELDQRGLGDIVKSRSIVWIGVLLALTAGCSEKHPKLVSVEGRVTLNGQPVVGALVGFQPDDPMGSPSYGETDEDGYYVLKFNPQREGAMLGMHSVSITTENENTRQAETLPAKYHQGREVKREVLDGKNVFDFSIRAPERASDVAED
jgi:hypothetical protein